ncbi:MAG TPA: YdeI/OmpD-associated family protein [Candidatus Saccharimonadales bacterium]|nr:YdeI/OmpD-associated family protein [Candidatus Saccharimonadales bacterium]
MIKFEAKLISINGWTIVHLPKEASEKLPSRGQVMVKGTINDFHLHTALEPDGNWGHWLNVSENMQKSVGIQAGDTVSLEIEATKDWPEPNVPADIQKAVDRPEIKPLWTRITPMARWEWLRWVNSTASPETRKHRIEVSCSKLLAGERRPCCFNRNMCCVPEVSKSGILLEPAKTAS